MRYMTVEECIRSNGDRHLERAIAYISASYPKHFSDGSLRKAKREYKKADFNKLDPFTQSLVDSITKSMNKAVNDKIMNGDGVLFKGLF